MKEYEINEELAKQGKESYSFRDYEKGSATAGYKNYLARFNAEVEEYIELSKKRNLYTEEKQEYVNYCADRYSKKLAAAINKENQIKAMCPSVMICGAGNFPVRKKEKQNKQYDKWMQENGELFDPENNYYINKIKTILLDKTIYSNDELVIEKLQNRLAELEENQKTMKEANAWYRKNKTMQGFNDINEEFAKSLDEKINESWYKTPYASFELTNNNAEIRRTKARIEEITKLKERANKEDDNKYPSVDGVEVVENSTEMRIQLLFDDIPSGETRDLLKSNGFKWSPKNKAWQRQLTANGIYATKRVLEKLM